MLIFCSGFSRVRVFDFVYLDLGFGFVMAQDGEVFQPCDCLVTDDCSRGFVFGAEDDDLMIDVESIFRILDEEPDSMEVWFATNA